MRFLQRYYTLNPKPNTLIIILLFLLIISPAFSQEEEALQPEGPEFNMEAMRQRIFNEAPQEIMNFSIRDTEVSFFLTGSWKAGLQGNIGLLRSPVGIGFFSPETLLLFTQEADIGMALWINEKWFVEANFMEDSAYNTYRAGFKGAPGQFVKYAGIGNTGLDFPAFPYLDIGGDSSTSFGIYSNMGTDNLNLHALFRYDTASREERIFKGTREQTYSYSQINDAVRGVSFVLPDTHIDSDIQVFIEDSKGELIDNHGRKWRKLANTEFAAGRSSGLLELSTRHNNMIAVSYSSNGITKPWQLTMGQYIEEVRQFFESIGITLANYPLCANDIVIAGVDSLVIYEPGTFSPFERLSRYNAPSTNTEQAVLVNLSTGTEVIGYELVLLDSSSVSAGIPLLTDTVSLQDTYELYSAGVLSDKRSFLSMWPLALEYPDIYFPGNIGNYKNLALRFTNYSNTRGYYIGTDVVPGSVLVWRSGIQSDNFTYNETSGEVSIHGSVGQNEIIRITYLKQSGQTGLGSIAAGLGFIYRKGASPFSIGAAAAVRWNLIENSSFTEEDVASGGTAGVSVKSTLEYDFLKAQISAGFSFDYADTTGLYRVAGMEGNESVLALPPDFAFISNPAALTSGYELNFNNRADLFYRNFYNNNIFGPNLMPITWDEAKTIDGMEKPYPVIDPQFGDVQLLALEFDLNKEKNWTGFQVPVGFLSDILSRAAEIEIPYRIENITGDISNFSLYIQIGALSGEDFVFNENLSLIWEQKLFDSETEFSTDARIVSFFLDKEDRLKLSDAKYLRIIAINENNEFTEDISARILIAPPIVKGALFRPVVYDGESINSISEISNINRVETIETLEFSSPLESIYGDYVERLHPEPGTQRVLRINWENMREGFSAGVEAGITELPFSDYNALSFFVKTPLSAIEGETIRIIISSGSNVFLNSQLEAIIPSEAFVPGKWSKVTVRYQGENAGVSIDNLHTPDAFMSFKKNYISEYTGIQKRKMNLVVLISPKDEYTSISEFPNMTRTMFIDEIILEDSITSYRVNAGTSVEYKTDGTFLAIRDIPVLSDFKVSNALESEFRIYNNEDNDVSGGFINRTGVGVSVFGIKLLGTLSLAAFENTVSWSADHEVSRVIGIFSFKEYFYASPEDETVNHNLNFGLSSDFYAEVNAQALYEYSRLNQKWDVSAGYRNQNVYIPAINIDTSFAWLSKNKINKERNYAGLWVDSWQPLLPDNGSGADNRKSSAQIIITERTIPVGASLSLEGITNYNALNNFTGLENNIYLDVPVSINRLKFNVRQGRGFKRHLDYSGTRYLDDTAMFIESVSDSAKFWRVFPFYSMFTSELNTAMDRVVFESSSSELARYTSFNDHFSTRFIFPSVYNLASFVTPARFNFRLERVMEHKLDTRSDNLNIGAGIGFSALNMFGSMGYRPIFKFYNTDEFTHSIETAIICPMGSDNEAQPVWRVQSIAGVSFRGPSEGVLGFTNNFTIRTDNFWIETFTIDWTVPTKKSPLSSIYEAVKRGADKQNSWLNLTSILTDNYQQFRKETLELIFDNTNDELKWNVILGHESIVRVLGRLELTAYVKLRAGEDLNTKILILDMLLGTTLRVSF